MLQNPDPYQLIHHNPVVVVTPPPHQPQQPVVFDMDVDEHDGSFVVGSRDHSPRAAEAIDAETDYVTLDDADLALPLQIHQF